MIPKIYDISDKLINDLFTEIFRKAQDGTFAVTDTAPSGNVEQKVIFYKSDTTFRIYFNFGADGWKYIGLT